eukprot:jgi/Chlat1/6837/Chrsp51S06527
MLQLCAAKNSHDDVEQQFCQAAAAAAVSGSGASGEMLRFRLDYGGDGDGGAAARFKGYKLDAAHHPQVSVASIGSNGDIDTQVREGRPDDEDSHFSLEYVRQFRMHNHLFVNPHSASPTAYYVSARGTIAAVTTDDSSNDPVPTHVARLPHPDTVSTTNGNEGEALPPSMAFPACDVAVVSNGAGALHVYEVADDSTASWRLSGSVYGVLGGDQGQGFVVRAAAMAPGSDKLLCVVQRVDEAVDQREDGGTDGQEQPPQVRSIARCNVTLVAAALARDDQSAGGLMQWKLHARTPFRTLRYTPAFLTAAASTSGDGFRIAALGGAELADGLNASSNGEGGKEDPHQGTRMHGGPTEAAARYSWSQDGSEVVLHKNINREDVQDVLVAFSPEHLRIEVIGKGEVRAPMAKKQSVEGDTSISAATEPLIWQLSGKLYGAIVPGFSTWAWTEDVLEVRMRKMDGSVRWPTVFEGDAAGLNVDETLSEDHVAAARAALSRFTHEGDLPADVLHAGTTRGPRAGIGAPDTPIARTPETGEADAGVPLSVALMDKGKIPDLFGEGADDEDEDGHVLGSGPDGDAGPHQLYVFKLDSKGRPAAEVPTAIDVNGRRLMCEAHVDGRPAMVLADDVHGCVCALSLLLSPPSVSHCATFPALQYVVSSKRERRHIGVFPAASRAFVCEVARTVYVYDRPEEGAEQAPSHVAMLEPVADDDAVLGAAAPDSNTLIVLTRRRVYCMRFR